MQASLEKQSECVSVCVWGKQMWFVLHKSQIKEMCYYDCFFTGIFLELCILKGFVIVLCVF